MDDPEIYFTNIILTGGEPFLFPDLIRKIFERYGKRFSFEFNTSGYCFTPEILEFLSHYHVSFTLSVDGDKYLTNYLRPTKDETKYLTGYADGFEKNAPLLLYYFPNTQFKIIVGPRTADLLYKQYLYAEKLGFKSIRVILDLSLEEKDGKNAAQLVWTEKAINCLQKEFKKIITHSVMTFMENKMPTSVSNIDQYLTFICQGAERELNCAILNGRSLISTANKDLDPSKDPLSRFCMSDYFNGSFEQFKEEYERQSAQITYCLKDQDCKLFKFCKYVCCIKAGLDKSGNFFDFYESDCILNSIVGVITHNFLQFFEELKDIPAFKNYINSIIGKGGL